MNMVHKRHLCPRPMNCVEETCSDGERNEEHFLQEKLKITWLVYHSHEKAEMGRDCSSCTYWRNKHQGGKRYFSYFCWHKIKWTVRWPEIHTDWLLEERFDPLKQPSQWWKGCERTAVGALSRFEERSWTFMKGVCNVNAIKQGDGSRDSKVLFLPIFFKQPQNNFICLKLYFASTGG